MNATLIDEESNSDNQSEKSTHDESGKFKAFKARIRRKSDKDGEKVEEVDSSEHSEEGSKMRKRFVRLMIDYLRRVLRLRK